jgi:hypothetical protein
MGLDRVGTIENLVSHVCIGLVEHPRRPHPRFGSARGRVHMSPDFDAPLDDFADYVR